MTRESLRILGSGEPRPPRYRSAQLDPDRASLIGIIADGPSEFVDNPVFHQKDAHRKLFGRAAVLPRADSGWFGCAVDASDKPQRRRAGSKPLLTAEQERLIFLQFNYARHRVAKLVVRQHASGLSSRQADELIKWHGEASRLRDQIVCFNLGLVLAMIKKFGGRGLDFGEMVCEGNVILLRSVDLFDVGRQLKFSTYACRSILRRLNECGRNWARHRSHFPVAFDPTLEQPSDHGHDVLEAAESIEQVRRIVHTNGARLTKMERAIICHRYGIGQDPTTPTVSLAEVARRIGYSKEAARLGEKRALTKLRAALGPDHGESAPRNNVVTVEVGGTWNN